MKPPYTHISRTALVVAAAAGAVWLSAFFLPGTGVQPVPLLPALGGVAGKIVSVAEPHSGRTHPRAQRRTLVAPVVVGTTPVFAPTRLVTRKAVPQAVHSRHARSIVHKRHRAVHHPRSVVRTQSSAPVQTPAAANPTWMSSNAAPRGKAVGWHRKHDAVTAPAAAPVHGHGNPHAEHHGPPSGTPASTQAPAAPAPPTAEPHDNGKHLGNGNGHVGGGNGNQGNGDQGHGPGGKK